MWKNPFLKLTNVEESRLEEGRAIIQKWLDSFSWAELPSEEEYARLEEMSRDYLARTRPAIVCADGIET